jgi:folate-binding protein YgfZ
VVIQAADRPESQYRLLREGAGLLDESRRGKLDVAGPDAADFLQGQVTNDVLGLEPGRGCYAALLNPKGRMLADMRILRRSADELWLDSEPAARESLLAKLDMYTIGRDVEIADRTGERAILSLIGPGAGEVVGVDGGAEEHSQVEVELDGVHGVAVTTAVGLDFLVRASDRDSAAAVLVRRGASVVDERAAEIVRIENGRPRYGVDMTDENFPGELGLEERAVSFTKGCYVGQEPVARMHYRGHPNRHLRGLELAGPSAPGAPVQVGDRELGSVTSSCVSPIFGPIALALLRREVEPGDEVQVGAGTRARVIELPFRRD